MAAIFLARESVVLIAREPVRVAVQSVLIIATLIAPLTRACGRAHFMWTITK
jgi:hypothetical protein